MSAKYIFRLDDICRNMNWNNYYKIKELFLRNQVRPLIGVIPNNENKELLKYPECDFDFWSEVKGLKYKEGWDIALHGYNHVYETADPGILKINKASEFAGMPKHKQNAKIMEGKKTLLEKGIEIDAFMAPAHSFDRTTIECLKDNGINVITDGYALFPYYQENILFVPQLFAKPRKMPFGVFTWCLHVNTMSDCEINGLGTFIQKNIKDIISFCDAKKYVICTLNYKIQNFFIKNSIMAMRKLRA